MRLSPATGDGEALEGFTAFSQRIVARLEAMLGPDPRELRLTGLLGVAALTR